MLEVLRKIVNKFYCLIKYMVNCFYTRFISKAINKDLKVIQQTDDLGECGNFNVLFMLNHCWNLADAYLPVLVLLKEKYKNVKIIVVCYSMNAGINRKKEKFLMLQLQQIADCIILNDYQPIKKENNLNKIKKVLLEIKEIVYTERKQSQIWNTLNIILNRKINKVNVILKGTDIDDVILKNIYYKYKDATSFIHPHTGYFVTNVQETIHKCYFDYYMMINKSSKKKSKDVEEKALEIGSPRYDKWWIDRIMQTDDINALKKELIGFKKIILVIFGELNDRYRIGEKQFKSFITVLKNTLENNPSYCVLIKLHSKNKLEDLQCFLPEMNRTQYKNSSLQLMQLTSMADLVLCPGLSTGIIDALIIGKPTIEYGATSDVEFLRYKCKDGKYGSLIRLHNLALVIDDENELAIMIDKILRDGIDWTSFKDKLKTKLQLNNNASELFVKYIIEKGNK